MSAPFANLAPVIARLAPQLYMLLWMLSLGGVLASVFAIYLARQAVRRIDNSADKRGLMVAQWALILGWAHIVYAVVGTVLGIFLQPFSRWLRTSSTSSVRIGRVVDDTRQGYAWLHQCRECTSD